RRTRAFPRASRPSGRSRRARRASSTVRGPDAWEPVGRRQGGPQRPQHGEEAMREMTSILPAGTMALSASFLATPASTKDKKGTELPTWYQTQVVAGTPPDIVNIQGGLWLEYASQGGLKDMTPLLERDKDYKDKLIPEFLSNWVYEGKQYGMPLYVTKTLLF